MQRISLVRFLYDNVKRFVLLGRQLGDLDVSGANALLGIKSAKRLRFLCFGFVEGVCSLGDALKLRLTLQVQKNRRFFYEATF